MVIEDKYFNLLNVLVYDKRRKMSGILSSLEMMRLVSGNFVYYRAYMNYMNAECRIFVEDFEKGNVVFLLPFGVTYMEKEMEEMAERNTENIKAFFGDKFREDMIMRISEDDRQEEIRKWQGLTTGLKNWGNYFDHKKDSLWRRPKNG